MSDTEEVETIFREFPDAGRDELIPILQAAQEHYGYLSHEVVQEVGRHLHLPASKVFGVATFYNQFRFEPIGKYHIQVCRGTACHVKGSLTLLETVEQELGIQPGQTARDRLFSLEVVACLGACGLAPVMCVNGEFFARMTPNKARALIEDLRKEVVST